MSLQLLRCTQEKRKESNTILLIGQLMWETDTRCLYIGDGVTEAKNLSPIAGMTFDGEGFELIDNEVNLVGASKDNFGGAKIWYEGNTLYIRTKHE